MKKEYEPTLKQVSFLLDAIRNLPLEKDFSTFIRMNESTQKEELFSHVFKKARESNDEELRIDLIKMLAFLGFTKVMNLLFKMSSDIAKEMLSNPDIDTEVLVKKLKEKISK